MRYTKEITQTLSLLGDHVGDATTPAGVTWQEAVTALGITRAGWIQRVTAARRFLAESPEYGYCIPRPTRANGWRFQLTNLYVDAHGDGVKSSHFDDRKVVLGFLNRLLAENETAYDKEVADHGKKSKRAKHLLNTQGVLTATATYIEQMNETAAKVA